MRRRRLVTLVLVTVSAVALSGLAEGPATAGPGLNSLQSGERLRPGEELDSARGGARFVMQRDGNAGVLVGARPVWSTRTNGRPGAVITMQTDGNLVVRSTDGVARWSSATNGNPGAIVYLDDSGRLTVQPVEDGPVWDNGIGSSGVRSSLEPGQSIGVGTSLYSPHQRFTFDVANGEVSLDEFARGYGTTSWAAGDATGRGATEPSLLSMQTDGNLVLRGTTTGTPYWNTRTSGRGNRFVVQDDGNLVVRNSAGRAVWSAGSTHVLLRAGDQVPAGTRFVARYRLGLPPTEVVFQTDGNLVAYDENGHASWSSGTQGHAGGRLAMQTDGNLVVYAASGGPLWFTGTAGCGSGIVFDTIGVSVTTSRGRVWTAAGGRAGC